jgi:acyl-CoA thioesterase I
MLPKLNLELVERAFRFFHPEKLYFNMAWPMPSNVDSIAARVFGVPTIIYSQLRRRVERQALAAARQMLADADFAAQVDRLPFKPGMLIAGVGDSITDDLLSWFELLAHLLKLRRPKDNLRCLNAGFSSDTSTHMLCRFYPVVKEQPDWILCMAGTNDARRHGVQAFKTAVSQAETASNLAALAHFAATQTRARWIWLTPNPILPERTWQDENLQRNQLTWQAADLDAVAQLVRARPEPVLDLYPLFGNPPEASLLMEDGLHPSLAGQVRIARALVEFLNRTS